MEEIINEELTPQFKTMFAKLPTLEAYTILNDAIGTSKSYPDERSDTFFYSDPNPTPVNGLYFMEITAEVQERFPIVLEGVELVEQIPEIESDVLD